MIDEAAFLSAIRAAPADAAPRLVYADWLEERGDGRAEFMRLQHQLAVALDRLQHLRAGLDRDWVHVVEVRRDLILHSFATDHSHAVTKLVRLHTGMGLEEARALLARLPATVLRDQSLERAERLRQEFAEVAAVTIEPPMGNALDAERSNEG